MLWAFRIALACLMIGAAAAQQKSPPIDFYQTPPNDPAIGEPYRTGEARSRQANEDDVPLRDFLSARIDQVRVEVLRLIDERDNQYSQRFDAQQKALSDALIAARETSANALAAAKEAVTKAEQANDKRFESVNEFRATLADQARDLMSREAAEAKFAAIETRFRSMEEKAATTASRLDNLISSGEGAGWLWGIIAGIVVIAGIITNLAINAFRAKRPL